MRKITLWGLGIVAIAGIAFWLFQSTGFATPDAGVGYSHNNYIGATHEGVSDRSPERTGYDRPSDRTPDGTPDVAVSGDTSGTGTGNPDCKNGPGDGTNIGNPCGHPIFAGDGSAGGGGRSGLPDRGINNPGDGTSDLTPDLFPAAGFDRTGDSFGDSKPERTNSDKFLEQNGLPSTVGDRVGLRDCKPADVAVGECDRGNNARDFTRDRTVGRDRTSVDVTPDATPDRVITAPDDPGRPNRDGNGKRTSVNSDLTPDRNLALRPNRDRVGPKDCAAADVAVGECDGIQDRDTAGTLRDAGDVNHSQPARDAYSTGPGDQSKDRALGHGSLLTGSAGRDQGGFGFGGPPGAGGGGGGGGCSYSTTASADLGLMLAMLLPFMLAIGFRLARRAAK